MSVERPELGCLCARLKVVEELWLLLGEVSVSAGRLKWLPQAAGAIPLLRQSAAMLPACCFSTAFVHQRKEFLELLLGFFWRRNRQGNANGGKIEHFPLTGSLCFEVKCTQAPGRKRSALDVVVSVLFFSFFCC